LKLKSQARSISGAGGKGDINSASYEGTSEDPNSLSSVSTRALKAAKAQKEHLKLRTGPRAESEIRIMAMRARGRIFFFSYIYES
jgi:hypothetical protein